MVDSGSSVIDAAVEDEIRVSVVDQTEQEEIDAATRLAGEVKYIPLGLIEKSEVALRGEQRQTESFQLLVNSIRKKGVLNSILVRQIDLPGGVVKYGLIDGLQRYTASLDAGLDTIPARIVSMDDAEVLEAQIITNMNRVATKPADLSKHLLRIIARNPFMTIDDLAEKTCQSRTWVEQRLSLNNLKPEIAELVNDGKIQITNAYVLSKIPQDEQAQHVAAAQQESPKTFVPRMKERAKEIKDANRKGKDAGKAEFRPQQHLQKLSLVKDEFTALHEDTGDSIVKRLLETNNVKSPLEAAKLVVAWVLNFDEASQAEQRRKADVRAKEEAEKRERLKLERERKKAELAAEAAADIMTGF